jgi:uncharacterized protein YqjF (DUF2071 family)
MSKTFLTAEWRKLILINYEIEPHLLLPYIPYGTELDLWKDKCYVSLVGFRFINTKIKGIAVPFHRNFEEINLRFYVRYKHEGEWRRGVTFIKEIVPRPALTFVANTIYKEKYITLPTRHKISNDNNKMDVSYEWKFKGDWNMINVSAEAHSIEINAGGEEEFITEHYWGYTPITNRLTSQYQVAHPRWQVYPVQHHSINVQFGDLYGSEFGLLKDQLPASVMLAEGSEIIVKSANKIS